MQIVVKFFPEISIKSKSVRLYFIKILTKNIYKVLYFFKNIIEIKWYWDYIEILVNDHFVIFDIIGVLIKIPGIHHILLVEKHFFDNKSDIFEKILPIYHQKLIGKSFCIRIKRYGLHNFTSQELECYLGDMFCKNIHNSFVKLVDSEEVINLEVKSNYFLLLHNRYEGLCGFPIGTQGEVLSLISGGFDSGVSSYMLIRRGCKVNYCFFKLGGISHENKVYKIVTYLWREFGSSHSVKFISVDFSLVLNEIFKNIHNSYMGIILKRMMIRASAFIARYFKISALVTGEVLGQVSSQTLMNLKLIDNIADIMIFRPLISYDKEDIITLSRKIGIERFSINVPEYCGVLSKKPTAWGSSRSIESEEKKFDFSVLDCAINQRKVLSISRILSKNNHKIHNVKFVNELNDEYVVIDIRIPDEQKNSPLSLGVVEIRNIPFYKLCSIFSNLDQNKMYLLYCGRGIMSHCQVLYLRDRGFNNVNVYLPL